MSSVQRVINIETMLVLRYDQFTAYFHTKNCSKICTVLRAFYDEVPDWWSVHSVPSTVKGSRMAYGRLFDELWSVL